MIPGITVVRLTGRRDRAVLPLLVLGPSPGTSATALWSACAQGLTDAFDAVAWDLPGQGHNRWVPEEPVTTAELAAGVLRVVDDVLTERGQPRGPFFYAGVSVGGDVGRQLVQDAPDRVVAPLLDLGHLTPAEQPAEVARLLREHFLGEEPDGRPETPPPAVLDPRTRAIVALTALSSRGRHDDLAAQVRVALRDGLTADEVEAVLQAAQQVLSEEGLR